MTFSDLVVWTWPQLKLWKGGRWEGRRWQSKVKVEVCGVNVLIPDDRCLSSGARDQKTETGADSEERPIKRQRGGGRGCRKLLLALKHLWTFMDRIHFPFSILNTFIYEFILTRWCKWQIGWTIELHRCTVCVYWPQSSFVHSKGNIDTLEKITQTCKLLDNSTYSVLYICSNWSWGRVDDPVTAQ